MGIAAAALAGLPPLSGYFSKEGVLATLSGLHNPVWLAAGLLGAFLTAYYAFRLVFILLCPRAAGSPGPTGPDPAEPAPHRWAHATMVFPVLLLTLATLLLGLFHAPLEAVLTRAASAPVTGHPGHANWLTFAAVGLALGGAGLAWWEFGRKDALQRGFVDRVPALRTLFAERWFIDHAYRALLDRVVYRGVARRFTQNDQRVVDGCVDGVGRATVKSGHGLSAFQSGNVQWNLFLLFVVLTTLVLTSLF
jgi:NADH-quinone oxidoreductase subunit L